MMVVLATIVAAVPASSQDPPFAAQVIQVYAGQDSAAMHMPTDVAVMPDGRVFVADGANGRIVSFEADARLRAVIDRIGDLVLIDPMGLGADAQGRLYIADSGRREVVIVSPDGSLARTLTPQTVGNDRPADLTDAAASSDGNVVWLVDNNNHRLIRYDLLRNTQTAAGRYGESAGQVHHPFLIALTSRGDALVTDVMNGRVSVFSDAGAPVEPVGSYGVELGQLYRPKGVACDRDGTIWVSDSVLCVVQVFSRDGGPIDVLRGDDGEPMRFASPMGIAFEPAQPVQSTMPSDGSTPDEHHLYVAELGAHRVVKLAIRRGPLPSPRAARPRARIVGGQARSCTVCHIEWIEPFSRNEASSLSPPPPSTPDEPFVSHSEMCLSCHDGSIADSRRRVWIDHGHQTGISAPPDMRIPDHLPLVDGKIACRTCHSAHAGGRFDADFRTAVFLRVPNAASELCISCHDDKTRGPQLGTHPIGGMPWAIPKELVEAGAKVGPNPRELTCQVCHTPHGSKVDHLLVMGTSSNQLCMTCHDQMRPGMFRDGDHTEHPLTPLVSAEQAVAITAMGTALGDEGRLVCLSCHKLHHGKGERFMLADELTDGRFCIRCHSEKTSMLGSSHDLRTNFPEERNRLGMTPQNGGPCSSCHMFHRYARAPEPSALDPGGGKCITCHQPDRCGGEKLLGAVNHPGARCVDCHDPHETRHPTYLRDTTQALCAGCHSAQTSVIGGPHDYQRADSSWPVASRDIKDPCLVCHRPHGDDAHGLFRFEGAAGGMDAGCRVCHSDYRWDAGGNLAALHPQEMKPGMSHGELPLVSGTAEHAGGIGCRTCHDPHVSLSAHPAMLRTKPGAPANMLCTTCHQDVTTLPLTGHGSAAFASAGFAVTACAPCHRVHGDATLVDAHRLMPRDLAALMAHAGAKPSTSDPSAGAAFTSHHVMAEGTSCVACHVAGGPAKVPIRAVHPQIVSAALPAALTSGPLPLVDEHGKFGTNGQITCVTCHLPHGRELAPEEMAYFESLPTAQRRAGRLMLRSFSPPNACTTCHGTDALRLFLYFHQPDRRADGLVARRPADGSTLNRQE